MATEHQEEGVEVCVAAVGRAERVGDPVLDLGARPRDRRLGHVIAAELGVEAAVAVEAAGEVVEVQRPDARSWTR